MLMNRLELNNWFKNKEIYLAKELCTDIYTPIRYREIGMVACNYYLAIWNEVGCVEGFIGCYKPVKGGTVMYDINGFSFA